MVVAALNDGALPSNGTLRLEEANKWCRPLGIITYWLDLQNSMWHVVIAWKMWSWVYHRQPVYVLCRDLLPVALATCLLAAGLTLIPAFEGTVGLTRHSHCFLTTFWKKDGDAALAFLLDRWLLLPICWVLVAYFNISTIFILRKDERPLPMSSRRLQLRLWLVTFSFCVLWGLMVVPSYVRTFAAVFLLQVSKLYR